MSLICFTSRSTSIQNREANQWQEPWVRCQKDGCFFHRSLSRGYESPVLDPAPTNTSGSSSVLHWNHSSACEQKFITAADFPIMFSLTSPSIPKLPSAEGMPSSKAGQPNNNLDSVIMKYSGLQLQSFKFTCHLLCCFFHQKCTEF